MERIADPAGAASAIQSLKGYLDELIRARRRQPEDDIVKETTIIAMGASMLYLARNPGLKARLRENAELLELAVEEFLRIEPPAQAHARTLSADVEVHGQTLRAGERVLLLWASAKGDADQFADPDRFVPDRHPNRYLTFGAGPHRCSGADLARIQIKVAIRQLSSFRITRSPRGPSL